MFTISNIAVNPKSGTQRPNLGFIQLSLLGWVAVAAGVVILGLSVALKVQTSRLDSAQSRIERMEEAGRQAEIFAQLRDKENKERKAKADANHKRTVARLNAELGRLRESANQSSLPPAGPGSRSPERITFDRGELDSAIRSFTKGTAGLVAEGAKAVEGLDVAKEWAQ